MNQEEQIFTQTALSVQDAQTALSALSVQDAQLGVFTSAYKTILDNIPENASPKLYWQLGFETNIGGGQENQDDFLVWTKEENHLLVLGMVDGHGRDHGRVAAIAAKIAILDLCETTHHKLLENPYKWLEDAFQVAHFAIKTAFIKDLEANGYQVQEHYDGYLLKRRGSQSWSCVHGGAACTIVVKIGSKIYSANVGDSSAILFTQNPILQKKDLIHLGDCARDNLRVPFSALEDDPSTFLNITAEHSAESISEYQRILDFKPCDDLTQPELKFVYDYPSCEKPRCPHVYQLNADGIPTITNNGRYYKNVRKEWASLVTTPGTARFQDALAFTRSLGDLHLKIYGVTYQPEIHEYDIKKLFHKNQVAQDFGLEQVSSQEINIEDQCSSGGGYDNNKDGK